MKYWLGKKMSEEHRRKISEANKGIRHSEDHRKKLSESGKGHRNALGHKNHLGHRHSEETKRKISLAARGKQKSDITKKKLSESRRGEKSHFWKGGLSLDPYPYEWTDDLRESIRKRDSYICQICGIHQDELNGWHKKLDVHHINYDKNDLNQINLVTLCRVCHMKTNFNRDYWKDYFLREVANGKAD